MVETSRKIMNRSGRTGMKPVNWLIKSRLIKVRFKNTFRKGQGLSCSDLFRQIVLVDQLQSDKAQSLRDQV